jgi:nucleotide-binding universal stress UspA family protein
MEPCVTPMRSSIPFHNVAPKKLLLATDFSVASTAAFRASLSLCDQFEADLYILHVVESASCAPPGTCRVLVDLDSVYRDAAVSVGLLIDAARKAGVTCEGNLVNGWTHDSILDVLSSQSCDLVVLGRRAIRGFECLVFASAAEAVICNALRPVLTVGPEASSQPLHHHLNAGIALFATDFHVMTTEAIRYAALFAKTMKLSLHCLHVLPRELEGDVSGTQISSIITEALKHLIAGLDSGPLPPVCAVTYGSEISNTVVGYARSHHARLIVLGVCRASLAASQVPAHIAYRVITEAPCPVVTIAFPMGPSVSSLRGEAAGGRSETRNSCAGLLY